MSAISDGFQNIAKEALNKPEIVELLLNNKLGTAGQTFKQKLESVLKRMPKIGTPSKSEYLPHFFRGAVFVLPQTDLMNKLDIENIYLQKVAIKYLQRQKTIHVAFQI